MDSNIDWSAAGTAISTGLTSIKTAVDIAKSLSGGSAKGVDQDKLAELLGLVISARTQIVAAEEAGTNLRRELQAVLDENRKMKQAQADKEHYTLQEVHRGAFAYVFSPSAPGDGSGATPGHWCCVDCFDHGEKRIIQYAGAERGADIFKCIHGHEIRVHAGMGPTKSAGEVKADRDAANARLQNSIARNRSPWA